MASPSSVQRLVQDHNCSSFTENHWWNESMTLVGFPNNSIRPASLNGKVYIFPVFVLPISGLPWLS